LVDIKNKIDELIRCIEEDIENAELNIKRLNEIRSLVIKRNYEGLSSLLQAIRQQLPEYSESQSRRQTLRKILADCLECKVEELTLTRLEPFTDDDTKEKIRQTRQRLREITDEMKKEYISTALLLSECSRINRNLLKGLFKERVSETVLYDSRGTAKSNPATAFVNMKL
jgi:tRNA U34 5-carboxymethylaminomethyl modifying GTPase MnmE/TrmE